MIRMFFQLTNFYFACGDASARSRKECLCGVFGRGYLAVNLIPKSERRLASNRQEQPSLKRSTWSVGIYNSTTHIIQRSIITKKICHRRATPRWKAETLLFPSCMATNRLIESILRKLMLKSKKIEKWPKYGFILSPEGYLTGNNR